MARRLRWVPFLAAALLPVALSSSGDSYPAYKSCVEECQKSGCRGERCFQHCKFLSDGKPIDGPWYIEEPLYLRWKQWFCQTDCRYHCMLAREDEREKFGDKSVKYHGKWPFNRVYGIQEPVSVALSALKLPLRSTKKTYYEYTSLWHIEGILSMNSWFWSYVYHNRDVELTEKLNISSVVALLGFSLILATRELSMSEMRLRRVMVFLWFEYQSLYGHGHSSTSYMGRLGWYYPSSITLEGLGVVAGGTITMLLEIYDFPPYQGFVYAHAISNAITIPLTYLRWSFVKDDAEFMTSVLLKAK